MNERDVARFWSKVERRGVDECWPWKGSLKQQGYGRFKYAGSDGLIAPRVAFKLAHGRWPEPCCCHRCDNPACVNPAHLFEGGHGENARDRDSKGRGALPDNTGSKNGMSKLDESAVSEIKRHLREGVLNQKQIGALFGVGNVIVCQIKTGARWPGVE